MSSVNKVILIGNLGRDPEIRATHNGGKIANLAVATSERWKDKNSGEWKEKTEWNRVAVYNERAVEICEKYLHKGSKIWVEGSLQTRKWQGNDGQDRYTTEIVVQRFRGDIIMLDSKPEQDSGGQRYAPQEPPARDKNPFGLEDEIPY